MERPIAAAVDIPSVHIILARRKRPNTNEFQLLFQRRNAAARTDAASWSFPGDYVSGPDLQSIQWDNYGEVVRKLFVIVEKGIIDDLGKKPAGMVPLRTQPLFQQNQRLFLNNAPRPCFLYLLDDITDADFSRHVPKAREGKRAAIDEFFQDDGARNGYAWIDVREVYKDITSTNSKPFASWIKDFLLGLSELKLNQTLAAPNNRSHSFQDTMHSVAGTQDMVGMQQMVMNGSSYESTPMPYMDQMQYAPYQQQPQMYFYPQQQQQFSYAQGRGQLKFRFPAHVLSLDVRTTGGRLFKDKIVSIGAALLTVDPSNPEPRMLQQRQFDFIITPEELDEDLPQELFAVQQDPKPEPDAIRAFHEFFMEISQKHPDLFIAADNPVLEVGIIDITASRNLPENLFTSILHIPAVEKRRNSNQRRDPIDLQSFASGLLKTDYNPVPVPSGPGYRWSTLKEYLEWYPALSGIAAGRSEIEFPFSPGVSPKFDATNKGWMFLRCMCILANRFDNGASLQPYTPYSPPMMVAGGGMPVQFAPQPYPSMLWQQQQQQQQQQQHYFQHQQMQQMQQQMQPGARAVGPHGHSRPAKHYNNYVPSGQSYPQQQFASRNSNPPAAAASISKAKGIAADPSKMVEDAGAQFKEYVGRAEDSAGKIAQAAQPAAVATEVNPVEAAALPMTRMDQKVDASATARGISSAESPLPKMSGSPQPCAPPTDVGIHGIQHSKPPQTVNQTVSSSKGSGGIDGQQLTAGGTPPKSVAPASGTGTNNGAAADVTGPSEKRAWKAVVAGTGSSKTPAAAAKNQSQATTDLQGLPQTSGGVGQVPPPQSMNRFATQIVTVGATAGVTAAIPQTITLPSGVEVEIPAASQETASRAAPAPDAPRDENARKNSGGGWNGDGTENRSSSYRGGRGGYRGGAPRDSGGRGHRGGGSGPRDGGDSRGGGVPGSSAPREHHSRGGGEGRGISRGAPRGGPGMGRGRGSQPPPG